jgi:hypothetical protein
MTTPDAAARWIVRLICCGREDGIYQANTWEEADQFRTAYMDAYGHDRAGIIERALPDPEIISDAAARAKALREYVAYQVKCAAYNQPLTGVDWTNSSNQRWLDVADRIIAALTQHAAEAVAGEREACARMVEEEIAPYCNQSCITVRGTKQFCENYACHNFRALAAAIRARRPA